MARLRFDFKVYAILLVVAALSCLLFATADDSSKSKEHSENEASVSDDNSSQENSKEKRSREEILFGNQQNKPNGLVDDLMGMSAEDDSASLTEQDKKNDKRETEDQKSDETSAEDNTEKRTTRQDGSSNDMMMESGADSWYNAVPISSSALQYLSNPAALKNLPSTDFTNSLYDQDDIYRRKRQLLGHPIPLRKRRSLRSSIGQMIQKRGIRMPRRSMRLKRQVDMEDLLNLLGNDEYYEEQQQQQQQQQISSPESDGWQGGNRMHKKHVPGHLGGRLQHRYRYPYTSQHQDDGLLSPVNDFDDDNEDSPDLDNTDDIDELMLLHPKARYVEIPETTSYIFPYTPRDEMSERFQEWLAKHAKPSIFSVSRRSAPAFYPLDYRYVPGYKKRSIFSHGNRMPTSYTPVDNDDGESDFGTWGHVVQTPEAYASAEDVARLYGLANLMAEGSDETNMRKRTV